MLAVYALGVYGVHMPPSRAIPLRIPPELLARIDDDRGDVPRAAWIRRACEAHLGGAHHLARNEVKVTVDAVDPLAVGRAISAKIAESHHKAVTGVVEPPPAPLVADPNWQDEITGGGECKHPKKERRQLGYATLCGTCGETL